MIDSVTEAEYKSLTDDAGFVELTGRSHVRLTGDDRQKFLHNFCTNDIKKLDANEICEAFVLNTKGKILGYVHALATESELLLSGHGNQAETLINHLDMYLIREDVAIVDSTEELASVFVCGTSAKQKLGEAFSGSTELPAQNRLVKTESNGASITIANVEVAGFGYLLICEKANLEDLKVDLVKSGIAECTGKSLEHLRVEQKTPWFGIDADDSNLPQELQRDEKAISFDKGCYLGQETVARIDARGRVNNLLVGFSFADQPPSIGEFSFEEKVAGRVTSVSYSPKLGSFIGLGYVRRQHKEPGTDLGGIVVL